MLNAIRNSLEELILMLGQLSDRDYTMPCPVLSNATIGEHTRHIIELFLCLERNYETGIVNYDLRARDKTIQSDRQCASQVLTALKDKLGRPDKSIRLQQSIDGQLISIQSTYIRELLYNLEHCIHHQALIKVALLQSGVTVDSDFGVARSTIEYRRKCAQ